jgi:uncharacterized protein (DUF2267 family)
MPPSHDREQPTPDGRERQRRQRHEARANTTYRKFLKEVSASASVPEDQAERIAMSVLRVLDQKLPWNEMAHLASELPSNLRELLGRCEPRGLPPAREIGAAEFLALVARDLDVGPDEAESYVRGVFRALAASVSPGEIEDVIHLLPRELQELWPSSR